MSTTAYKRRVGPLMSVWTVTYRWVAAVRGCGPAHDSGATPDEPAHAEIGDVVLTYLGAALGPHWHYVGNADRWHGVLDEQLWLTVQEIYTDTVVESDRLQQQIEEWESQPA